MVVHTKFSIPTNLISIFVVIIAFATLRFENYYYVNALSDVNLMDIQGNINNNNIKVRLNKQLIGLNKNFEGYKKFYYNSTHMIEVYISKRTKHFIKKRT